MNTPSNTHSDSPSAPVIARFTGNSTQSPRGRLLPLVTLLGFSLFLSPAIDLQAQETANVAAEEEASGE